MRQSTKLRDANRKKPPVIVVKSHPCLTGSGAVRFALNSLLEMIDEGTALGEHTVLHDSFPVITCSCNGILVGILVHREFEDIPPDSKYWFVQLGYVRHGYRRHGIYKRMWKHLVEMAQTKGIARIEGNTLYTNQTMHKVMQALSRVPQYVGYRFEVPKLASGIRRRNKQKSVPKRDSQR